MKVLAILLIFLLGACQLCDGQRARRVKRIVGGILAARPPPDDPVVFARAYSRDARVEGYLNVKTGLYSFLGIRFAHPPIGNDRFRRPRYKRLEGDVNATVYGQPCPQPDSAGYIVGDEDCLWLNVFTPQMPDETSGLPVLVFIHPGGYRYGSANQYTADSLTTKNVIFVPIQYRLGTLGILSDGTTELSGNAALFDMAAAVRWVYEYIKFFGGDSKQITIMGHGSSAAAATYLTASKVPRSMITGVVAMSGSPYSQYTLDETPQQSVQEIAKINSCPTTNETEIVNCMRKKKFEEIIKEDSKVQIERLQGKQMLRSMTGSVGYGPHVETPANDRSLPGLIEEHPRDTFNNGSFKKVPLLTGVTRDETAGAINVKNIEKIFASATDFLNSVAKSLVVDGLVGNLVDVLLPGLTKTLSLNDYLKVSKELGLAQVLTKLTEATTDALFNLPTLVTTKTWSKVAPAYLYSFEYSGRTDVRGSTFLSGLPLVADSSMSKDKVAHGDELIYLFDARNIYGALLPNQELKDATDKKVRNIFSNLITKFAYLNSNKGSKNQGFFQEYKDDDSNFMRIGPDVSTDTDFRFCQLSLWGLSLKPSSKDASCAFILDQLTGTLGTLTGSLGLGGLGGTLGLQNKNNSNSGQQKPGGLLGLGGTSDGNGLLGLQTKNNSSRGQKRPGGSGLLGLGGTSQGGGLQTRNDNNNVQQTPSGNGLLGLGGTSSGNGLLGLGGTSSGNNFNSGQQGPSAVTNNRRTPPNTGGSLLGLGLG